MANSPTPAPGQKASSLAVGSWILYDFANTIFSVSILSYFFPLWLGDELGAGADLFNYITAASMLLVALTAPVFGAVADLRQRRKPYLILLTLLAGLGAANLDLFGTAVTAAAVFIAANFAYQSTQIFYNSLLPGIAGERGAGKISGYGVAAGYIGSILALLFLTLFVTSPAMMKDLLGPLGFWIQTETEVNSNAFVPTAVLYLLFSLPAFFFVPDRQIRRPRPVRVVQAYRDVLRTVRDIRLYPGMGAFIIATFLFTDAANTVVTNMSLYGRVVFDMEQSDIRNLLIFSTIFAVLGATGFGFVTDRIGPKRAMITVVCLWLVSVLVATSALQAWMLLLAGPLVGISLGSTWVVSRVMLVSLSPPEKVGEFFGFYALAGRFSAVTGPLLTGLILTIFAGLGPGAYRLAVFSLFITLSIALVILLRVPDKRPDRVVREFSGPPG
jgi:UMF1 family MFS transporter